MTTATFVVMISTFACVALLGIIGNVLDIMGDNVRDERTEFEEDDDLKQAI